MTLVSCASNGKSSDVTTVVFDGQTQTINAHVTCTTQPDGKLVILAAEGGRKTVRVLLSRAHHLVAEKVGIRILGASGFTDNSGEVWVTKADDTYKINGRMPPNAGETTWHQFDIEARCRYEVPFTYQQPGAGAGSGYP